MILSSPNPQFIITERGNGYNLGSVWMSLIRKCRLFNHCLKQSLTVGWQISRLRWRKHTPLSCGRAEFGRLWGEWTPGHPGARRQTHGAGTPAALSPGPRLPWKAPADQVSHCENTNGNRNSNAVKALMVTVMLQWCRSITVKTVTVM